MGTNNSELFQKALQELDVPIPRKLKFRPFMEAWDIWGMIYLSIVVFMIYLFLITYFLQSPYLSSRYGKPALATISNLYNESGRNGYKYYIQVDYLDNFIKENGTIEISPDDYRGLKMGNLVPIHYLSVFHTHPSLDMSSPWSVEFAYYVIFFFFLLPVGLFWNSRGLLVRGRAIVGQVSNLNDEIHNNKYGVNFTFEGKAYRVNFGIFKISGKSYFEYKPDQEVIVLVNPKRPKNNIIYIPSHFIRVPVRE